MTLKRKLYRNDMIRCAICHNALCTEACGKMDPAGLLRSIWLDNDNAAAARMPAVSPCTECDAPCEKSCRRNIPVKEIMEKLHGIRDEETVLTEKDYERLKTNICGIPMENPFVLSSSVVGSTYDMCARAFEAGWAGACFKTICLMEIHEASPRFSCIKGESGAISGFKNIEQLSDHSLLENLIVFHELKKDYPDKLLIASIMGRDDEEWEMLARASAEAGADVIELNFSCPNMVENGTGSDVGQCPDLVERFTRAARRGTDKPILAKLTPNVGTMSQAGEAAKRGGADGLAAINTIKSLIEISEEENKVAVGGFSGNAVRPIAMRFIAELAQNKNLEGMHLSAMGGIETWRDAAEFLALGAGSLQITTAVMQYGYRIVDDLKEGLALLLKHYDATYTDLIGCRLKEVVNVEEMERDIVIYPKFIRDKCIGCGRCYVSCMDGGHQAISFGEDRKPVLKPDSCVGCHLCTLVCPQEAVVSSGIVTKRKKKEQ